MTATVEIKGVQGFQWFYHDRPAKLIGCTLDDDGTVDTLTLECDGVEHVCKVIDGVFPDVGYELMQ